MLTVSLHKIELHALVGLYEEEQIHGNNFEIDVDLFYCLSIKHVEIIRRYL